MIKISFLLLANALLLTTLFACSTMPIQGSLTSPEVATNRRISTDYQIGPEDVLEVQVWKNEALSKVVTVRPDGKISLPLIGDVPAAGLTAAQMQEAITEKLTPYYKDLPSVSVIVQEVRSYVIYVLGEVQRPAQYTVKRGTTLLQAVALAGGFTPFAATNNILVLRQTMEDHNEIALSARYKDIVSRQHPESNILLKPGDTIIIP
jgi:polysaccharide export outer membrane protein